MVLNGGGVTSTWYKVWTILKKFGYGTDNVEVFPCFAPSGKITTDANAVRLSEYRNKDGSAIVAASSFGYAGKTQIKFAYSIKEAIDLETGKKIPVSNNSVEIELRKNDFKLIKVK